MWSLHSDNCMGCICTLCYPVGWFGNMDRRFTRRTKQDWNFNHIPFSSDYNFIGVETFVAKTTEKTTGRRAIQQLNLKQVLLDYAQDFLSPSFLYNTNFHGMFLKKMRIPFLPQYAQPCHFSFIVRPCLLFHQRQDFLFPSLPAS